MSQPGYKAGDSASSLGNRARMYCATHWLPAQAAGAQPPRVRRGFGALLCDRQDTHLLYLDDQHLECITQSCLSLPNSGVLWNSREEHLILFIC
jgi:hypothetical protein